MPRSRLKRSLPWSLISILAFRSLCLCDSRFSLSCRCLVRAARRVDWSWTTFRTLSKVLPPGHSSIEFRSAICCPSSQTPARVSGPSAPRSPRGPASGAAAAAASSKSSGAV